MKISLKIFVFTYCVMMCITVVTGFMLVNYLYRTDLEQAKESALENNEVLYTYVATIDGIPDVGYVKYSMADFVQRMAGTKGHEKSVFIGTYDAWKQRVVLDGYDDIESGQVISSVIQSDNGIFVQVTSRCSDRYIINYYDITKIIAKRDSNYNLYRQAIIVLSMVIAIVLYVFSRYITKPIEKITSMAEKISAGDYSVRTDADYRKMKSYEVAKLGETLNELAENTEQHIADLENLARKNEDFVGNFTHEIKTPMTSIIGYADLLRTYDLEPDKRREYSNFIYRESKRLETLSINLLQLIVMGKKEFDKISINAGDFFARLKESVLFVGKKYSVDIDISYDDAELYIEPSLLIAAVVNLTDNACKASGENTVVKVKGTRQDKTYNITVSDNGCGIPEDEIAKIIEPFYMVDKSRARKQGGAGLGLALSVKIADIHGGKLDIKSEVDKGTDVTITIPLFADKSIDIGGESDEA